jgi:hypothetical protein
MGAIERFSLIFTSLAIQTAFSFTLFLKAGVCVELS